MAAQSTGAACGNPELCPSDTGFHQPTVPAQGLGRQRRKRLESHKDKGPSQGRTRDQAQHTRIRRSQREEPSKAKAADAVHRVVGPVLLDLLKDHKQGIDRYEQAILFIGDAANPQDPKQAQGK